MKHLRPTRYDLYEKAINYQPKTKHVMITVDECLLFSEWLSDRYDKVKGGWQSKANLVRVVYSEETQLIYTTKELYEKYEQFLGKKPKPNP
jgi:hypothetical protein